MLWRWLKSLLKRMGAAGTVIIILVLVLTVGGAVLAAWSVTREASTTAMVLGTFTLDGVVCENAVPDETVLCSAPVTNQYDQVATITSATLVADRADVTVFADWGVQGRPGQNVAQPVNPGETVYVEIMWKPNAGALPGAVGFTMQVTAVAD